MPVLVKINKDIDYRARSHKHYLSNTQFDYSFLDDDNKLYCAEIVENAFRTAGVILSDPVPIRCLPNYPKYAWLRVLAECLTEIGRASCRERV